MLRTIEEKYRLSKSYNEWVQRNKAANCLCCGASEYLQCHHVFELYHVLFGLWKLYGNDEQKIYDHLVAMHDDDKCESATLCNNCHKTRHPGRSAPSGKKVRTDSWTPIPRNFNLNLFQSNHNKPSGHLGLIGFQTLLGIGWYILNGHLESRIITFNRRRFAQLIDKTPSSSFNLSFDEALSDLKVAGVLLAKHRSGNNVELHLSDEYLSMLLANPWFVPFNDIKTNRSGVLMLKYWLNVQSNRTIYRISLKKLVKHIGIHNSTPQMVKKALRTACKHIKWAKVTVDKGECIFILKKRGSTPILSLRQCLQDAIEKGK